MTLSPAFTQAVTARAMQLVAQSQQSPRLKFRGAALALQSVHSGEVVIGGPSETGKTIAALTLVDTLARENPKLRGAIVRKMRVDMDSTVLDIFKRHIWRPDVIVFGGSKPEWYEYPNGSILYVGGMDRPGRVLSGSLDLAYINQAEELSLPDWETFTTRVTGRAGVLQPGLMLGDCNPGPPTHWLKARPQITMLESRHEDNPALYGDDGQITAQGQRTMAVLDALTGVRKERLRYGRWVSAEGTVYAFDPALHLIDEMPEGWQSWRKIRAVDFGYTNPFVCHWWAIDPDGRMYLYREIYMSGRLVEDHAVQIKTLSAGERIEYTTADHDAEDRATLERHGVTTIKAKKEISVGIQAVEKRLAKAGDGKPRLFILRGATVEIDPALRDKHLPTSTLEETDVYSWPKGADGKSLKEVPIDANNHGMDAKRYAVRSVDAGMGDDWGAVSDLGHVEEFKSKWQ